MQSEPLYDYPDPQPPVQRAGPQRASLKSISVLDRLLLTHPVWLQLSINSATALHILQREPPGTFLVRKSSTSQKKVLCVRLADASVPSFVKQCVIRELNSTFSLESAAISFPDLCRLIAFYCVSRDVLPFTLELPEAIAKATSHKQLESISHMGVEFWSSQLNFRGPRDGPQPPQELAPPLSPSPEDCSTPQGSPTLFQEFCPIRTRGPRELDCGRGQGALCFINPLFLQSQHAAVDRRRHFKRSLKVRVSTETIGPLSPPVAPPPPPPLLAKTKGRRLKGGGGVAMGTEPPPLPPPNGPVSDYLRPGPLLPPKKGVAPPGLPPTAEEEEEYHAPGALLRGGAAGEERGGEDGGTEELREGSEGEEEEEEGSSASARKTTEEVGGEGDETAEGEEEEEEEEEEEWLCVTLEDGLAPSLSELDSCSSLSSLEEATESCCAQQQRPPPLTRGSSIPAPPPPPRQPGSALRALSAAFASFFVPERRVARLVEGLAADRRTAFGGLVQDFLRLQREEELKPCSQSNAVELLRKLRLFLSQAKSFLLDCGELEPPIETLVPEEEIDVVLEKALYRCVLKPLKAQLDSALRALQHQDGSAPDMARCLGLAREGDPEERFGVRGGVAEAVGAGLEKGRRKLRLMRRAYSPLDKLAQVLQMCKLVYSAIRTGAGAGREFGADDFLPVLSYFLVQVNEPELLTDVLYMMELLDPAYLTGEGGYYLTSVYASLCLVQRQSDALPPGGLTREARRSLRAWSRRRSNEAQQQQQQQRCVRVLYQPEGGCSELRTLRWRAGESADQLTRLCAASFLPDRAGPPHQLYWRRDGQLQPLPLHAQIHHLQGQGRSGTPLLYQHSGTSQHSTQESGSVPLMARGGAVDLGD